ncbi:MAG: site-specific integrase, partial [Prevotella sp.]|nr:site-specific integrase [Prevotella sp.]
LSPHKLRSGFCSIMYSKTHDIEFVRRAVGHSNVATTQRYIVTNKDEKKKSAEIMESILGGGDE